MRKILSVPYYSQKIDVSEPHWQERACGILCLKMVLDFLGTKTPSSDEFIQLGVDAGAYGEWGWTHTGLVSIASSLGIILERKEFRSQDPIEAEKLLTEGVNELVASLEKGKPVLISAIKKWIETKRFHMMVLVGFEMDEGVPACPPACNAPAGAAEPSACAEHADKCDTAGRLKGFYYHDPDAYTPHEGKDQFVPIETFKKHWRRMAIFTPF